MTDDRTPLSGGCLCGGVRYSYVGELGGAHGAITQCHCEQCRKAQGGPASVAPGAATDLVFTTGAALITEYESSRGKFRAFCGRCGSPLYSRRAERPATIRLRLGALDDPPPDLRIEAHIFVDDSATWEDGADVAPRYPGLEPER
jgi:hypothetical protein